MRPSKCSQSQVYLFSQNTQDVFKLNIISHFQLKKGISKVEYKIISESSPALKPVRWRHVVL